MDLVNGTDVSSGSRSGSGRVWMSLMSSEAKDKPPTEYNALLLLNKQFIHIIERCDSCMQVMMDGAEAKRRGAKKSVGRRGGNRSLMGNGLAQFNLMVGLKMTEFARTRLLPNNKFLADR